MLSPGLVWFPTHEELGGGGRWSGPFTYKAVDNRQTQRGHGCLATAGPTPHSAIAESADASSSSSLNRARYTGNR